jgi:long-chain fatty acid transport protein
LILLLILATSGVARAGGFSNPDFGIRRLGMFAVVGKPDDVTAIFHNPAGLTLQKGTHLYHAQSWFLADLGLRLYDSQGVLHPDHEVSPNWNVGAIPFLGLATDLGSEKWRVGVAAYIPNAYGASMPRDQPTRYHATRALFLAPRVTAAVAYELSRKMSIAAAINVIYVYMTLTNMRNALVEADPDARFLPYEQMKATDATQRLDGHAWAWAADFGVLFHPTERFHLGAAFAGGSSLPVTGTVRITAVDGSVEESSHRTGMVIPFTLRAGFNWEFAEDFELGMDIYYWHYQVLQEQRSVFDPPLYGAISEQVAAKNYTNSWDWAVGLMYHLNPAWELMCGFQMDFTPIPTATYTLDNPSRDQLGISLGARWQLARHWRVGAAFVRNWFNLPDVQDNVGNPPANAKGHGANSEFGFDISYEF